MSDTNLPVIVDLLSAGKNQVKIVVGKKSAIIPLGNSTLMLESRVEELEKTVKRLTTECNRLRAALERTMRTTSALKTRLGG